MSLHERSCVAFGLGGAPEGRRGYRTLFPLSSNDPYYGSSEPLAGGSDEGQRVESRSGAVSFFLIGRDNTLPLEIWSRLRPGMTPEINAISTVLFLFSLAAILLWFHLRTRTQQTEITAQVVSTSSKD